ncbi:NADP-dependent oxidoreductase domain-containing protein [Kockovaella imperatae]|uniref:NADP-dependent oxidoreductase domain-containing protein n=1 Tax=Kockovaella imperatae TaxID=4999 RepID=A0A1Y1UGV6_9TREE|nr:NADP-dependent oxidoreductase domain-containing protein [Kockovaella imperatae]ORX36734.1 NADP-dependent oxidoreductase domain-containing protein [Kockovaella imperatae]
MVRTIKLNDGKEIPSVAWGTASGGMFGPNPIVVDRGAYALKQGIPHLDTAQVYRNEVQTGEAFKKSGLKREDVFITSKIGMDQRMKTTHEHVKKQVQDAVERLGLIPDAYLIHNPFIPEEGKIVKFWSILESLVEDGTLKGCSLGVSNFREVDLEELLKHCKIKPTMNQIEMHPYVMSHLDAVFAIHKEHNIISAAYSPQAPLNLHPTGGPLKPVLEKIAAKYSKETGKEIDPHTVLLLWIRGKNAIAVTSTATPERIDKLAALDKLPDLFKEDVDEIERVGRTIYWRANKSHMTKDRPVPDLPDGTSS